MFAPRIPTRRHWSMPPTPSSRHSQRRRWINGALVARYRVAPFIATLGMLYVARGAALLVSGGATFPNLVGEPDYGNQGFPWLGAGSILRIPFPVWLLAGIALSAAFLATR